MILFDTPKAWSHKFEFVLESYTLQVLPPDLRQKAIGAIADLVAEGGTLLIICRARLESEPTGANALVPYETGIGNVRQPRSLR